MSTEWVNIVPFTVDDFDGDLPPTSASPTGVGSQFVVIGSGINPAISLKTDYFLRDEYNEAITDENDEPISLEGMTYA